MAAVHTCLIISTPVLLHSVAICTFL